MIMTARILMRKHLERARAVAGACGAHPYNRIEDLLVESPDAVFVASPLPDHPQSVEAALRAGAHVLCEKPLANTVDGCRALHQAAAAADRILAVGFNHRYYPAIAYLKECVDAGRIGRLDHLRVFGGHDGLHNFKADWQYRAPASGGGAMMDVGIHMTDLARYIAGDLTSQVEMFGGKFEMDVIIRRHSLLGPDKAL